MLQQLKYEAKFASTGRTLKEEIAFQKGFGTITGPNEAGKSFVIEMVRWIMFGSAALRSGLSDYLTLKGALTFSVGNKSYRVERTKNNAKVFDQGGTLLATGTGPVNAKVVELLGFGLPVFDIACVANQGDLERLGDMKPTERKRMVDTVLGLGVIDDLAKWAGEESRQAKRAAAEAERFLTKPEAPAKPAGYQPSVDLEPLLASKTEAHNRILLLTGKLVAYSRPTPLGIDELRQQAEDKRELQSLINQLDRLPPPPTLTEPELVAIEAQWAAYDEWVSRPRLTKPAYTLAALDAQEELIKRKERWRQKVALEVHIRQLERDQLECPACHHRWSADDQLLPEKRKELETYSDLTKEPPAPKLTRGEISLARQAWELWEQHQKNPNLVEVDQPSLSRQEIRAAYMALGFEAERERLIKEIDGRTPDPTDFDTLIQSLQKWLDSAQAQAEIDSLYPQAEGLEELRTLVEACRFYDQLQAQYETALVKYQAQLADVQKLKDDADQWVKVQAALIGLRAKVKQYFVPSLNKVASHFLHHMTGGQRQRIVVDEEFNIEVDGQGLHTLSGSGKAVANLAIRLGLGQVLTNNVFSLFAGDEIDASMDKNRAENTSRVLHTLKSRIYQILLVTHKYPTADYYIYVGETDERLGQSSAGGAESYERAAD